MATYEEFIGIVPTDITRLSCVSFCILYVVYMQILAIESVNLLV